MPIKIPDNLPAKKVLEDENIFVMNKSRALTQDIRELKIVILNLMPLKEISETQLIRLLSNVSLQIEITLIHTSTHKSKNTSSKHLKLFYKTFDEIKNNKYDGMIITGAPVETIDFEEVNYWNELKTILDWQVKNVTSTMHICWAAFAGLYYHFDIAKHVLENKIFGIFEHNVNINNSEILRGFDDSFFVPHSRYSTFKKEDFKGKDELIIIAESKESGILLVATKDKKHVFVTGHFEYDKYTLRDEYLRDINMGLATDIPKNYFKEDNPNNDVMVKWRAHANLLFSNWLNYYVYQETPYNLDFNNYK